MTNSAQAPTDRTNVPLLDLVTQYRAIEDEIKAAMDEVCASQQFILGPKVAQLEEQIADYCQCRYGIGVSSGTDALLLALMALDVGPGDEVITTPYTFFASTGAIWRLGARPVFCDIDPHTFNIEPEAVSAFIQERCVRRGDALFNRESGGRVKALMPVHLYGRVADMDALLEIAREYKLRIIEDAAQAIGAEDARSRRAGSSGDIGCFSFFPTKNLGAFGDAGMCTTNDPELAERMRILRVHGGEPKYYHSMVGANFRLDALQAAVLLVKLKYLDEWTAARQDNALDYGQLLAAADLKSCATLPAPAGYCRHIYNQYVLRVAERDALREYLSAAGIGTEIYYPVALHSQACFSSLGHRPEDFPESTRAANETLALPIYPELSAAQRRHVVGTISAFYHRNSRG